MASSHMRPTSLQIVPLQGEPRCTPFDSQCSWGRVALETFTNGNSISRAMTYNSRLQPLQLYFTAGTISSQTLSQLKQAPCPTTAATIMSRSYNFGLGTNDNGNVQAITDCLNTSRTQNFDYDNLNRLLDAYTTGQTTAIAHWGEVYTIDPWGNLTNIAMKPGWQHSELLNAAPASTKNQLNGFCYDAAGNMTGSTCSPIYTYDAENRLSATTGYTYLYDGDGKRVIKCNGTFPTCSSGTLYWTGTGSDALAETNWTGAAVEEYVFFGGKRIARRDGTGNTVHYYFADHLGSTAVITGALGSIQKNSLYYPFGGEIALTAPSFANNYKFTGKERDSESGLDNFGARYYGSSFGRFMQADPITVTAARQVDPQQLNLYAYVRNNPLKLVDPTGMIIDETQLSEKDLEKWQDVEKLAAQKDANGNLVHPELNSEIVALQQDSRTYTLEGASGLGSGIAGEFKITNFTPDGKDFTAATIKLDFSKIANGNGQKAADYGLGYVKFGGLNDNTRRFAELVGHEFAHGLFAMFMPQVGTEIQRRINEGNDAFASFRAKNAKAPLPPDVVQKMVAGNNAEGPTERFAQQIEKIVNGELIASEKK
jgi:RHS repeat-associated protein